MTCARVGGWLQLYVDGRLDVRQLGRLEEHLEACAVCRADLLLLEIVCQGAAGLEPAPEPTSLTAAIMRRIAELEARRASAPSRRLFQPGWGDAALAALLATLATAVFMIVQPALWQTSSSALLQALAPVEGAAVAFYSSWSSWLAWVIWVGVGLLLALWFAGGEVRAGWRRTLLARLPHS
jgi:anti-sigma factor RsiW